MAKKRMPSGPRHLRAVPPPAPKPPTFAELVAQLDAAYRADQWRKVEKLCEQLAAFPEAQRVVTDDPQKRYFALAAWFWKNCVLDYAVALGETEGENDTNEALLSATLFHDAVAASRAALSVLVTRLYERLGASGASDPSLYEVCQDFLAEIEHEMFEALREAENQRIAEREAEQDAQQA